MTWRAAGSSYSGLRSKVNGAPLIVSRTDSGVHSRHRPYNYSCTVAEAAYLVVDDREHRRERRLDGGDAGIMGVVAAGCEGSDPTTVHAGACGGLGGPVS